MQYTVGVGYVALGFKANFTVVLSNNARTKGLH